MHYDSRIDESDLKFGMKSINDVVDIGHVIACDAKIVGVRHYDETSTSRRDHDKYARFVIDDANTSPSVLIEESQGKLVARL